MAPGLSTSSRRRQLSSAVPAASSDSSPTARPSTEAQSPTTSRSQSQPGRMLLRKVAGRRRHVALVCPPATEDRFLAYQPGHFLAARCRRSSLPGAGDLTTSRRTPPRKLRRRRRRRRRGSLTTRRKAENRPPRRRASLRRAGPATAHRSRRPGGSGWLCRRQKRRCRGLGRRCASRIGAWLDRGEMAAIAELIDGPDRTDSGPDRTDSGPETRGRPPPTAVDRSPHHRPTAPQPPPPPHRHRHTAPPPSSTPSAADIVRPILKGCRLFGEHVWTVGGFCGRLWAAERASLTRA